MDETTEPLIAVFGHPIAGHPAQFALEKALKHLSLEHRVISFDVVPERIDAALSGVEALGFQGVYLDTSLRMEASRWYAESRKPNFEQETGPDSADSENGNTHTESSAPDESTSEPDSQENTASEAENALVSEEILQRVLSELAIGFDCLSQSDTDGERLLGSREEAEYLRGQILEHFQTRGRRAEELLIVPDRSGRPGSAFSLDRLAAADIVVLPRNLNEGDEKGRRGQTKRAAWTLEDWPKADKLVVVLSESTHFPSEEEQIQLLTQRGYTVVTSLQILVGGLVGCLRRWTGQEVSHEILTDAVEEYTAV